MADSHESTSNQTSPSATNFTAIFDAASNKYKTLTGQDLRKHTLATELESNSNSPDSILAVFRKQAQALDKFRKNDDKLIKSLTPIVNILFTFSTAGANIGLVRLLLFPLSRFYDMYFLVILSHNGSFYWYWCSSWGESLLGFVGAHFRNIQLTRW